MCACMWYWCDLPSHPAERHLTPPRTPHPAPVPPSLCPPQVALSSDEEVFGGYRNVTKDSDIEFHTAEGSHDGRPHSFKVGWWPEVIHSQLSVSQLVSVVS